MPFDASYENFDTDRVQLLSFACIDQVPTHEMQYHQIETIDTTGTGLFVGDMSVGSVRTLSRFISGIASSTFSHRNKNHLDLKEEAIVEETDEDKKSTKTRGPLAFLERWRDKTSNDYANKIQNDNQGTFRRLAKMNSPEWKYAIWGVLGAACMGAVQPVYALILSKSVNKLYNPGKYSRQDFSVRIMSIL